jgi:hypothetical protein
MRNLKALAISAGALVSFFVIGVQLYVWITVYGVAHQIQSSIEEIEGAGLADTTFAPDLEITGIEDGGHNKYGYAALTSFGKMHDYRTVSVRTYVRLDDMLDPGEAPPENLMLPAFVTARVVRIAERECELVKSTLAAACTVSGTQASPSEHGFVDVSMTLNFVERGTFGNIKSDKKAAYVEINQSLTGSNGYEGVSFSRAEEKRRGFYQEAVDYCGRIRNREGNCAIFNVVINASPDEPSNGARQNVSAFAVLTTITPL